MIYDLWYMTMIIYDDDMRWWLMMMMIYDDDLWYVIYDDDVNMTLL